MAGEQGLTLIGWAREDRAHDQLVKTLARRVVIAGASWDLTDALDHMWRWSGPAGEPDFKITGDVELGRIGDRPIKLHGKIGGRPLAPEARMYRTLLLAFDRAEPRPHIVILARDGDGRALERRRGFRQVVEGISWSFEVILAMPEPESEAWFVCGFEAIDESERSTHAALTRRLSFDPVTQPHRLTSRPNDAHTDAKRVLAELTANDAQRREACLTTELERLAAHGRAAGLAQLLEELRAVLLPLIDPAASRRSP